MRHVIYTLSLATALMGRAIAQDSAKAISGIGGSELSSKQAPAGQPSEGVHVQGDTATDKLDAALADSSAKDMNAQLRSLIVELKKTMAERRSSPPPSSPLASPILSAIKLGFLAQVYGQASQEQTSAAQDTLRSFQRHWMRQIALRRLRVLLAGDVAGSTSFFVESDATNIGGTGSGGAKDAKVSMFIQDAYIQHTFVPEIGVIAGLQLVGITRNSLQSAASLMALNYGKYQFVASTPLDNSVGRDIGVNLRGFLADQRLEYRAGVFSGKNFNQYSPLRTVLRFSYMFDDREKGFFYTGTTLGKGKLLSVGGGLDIQGTYRGYAIDAVADLPAFESGSVTASASLAVQDGGGTDTDSTFFTGVIPRQTIVFGELGYFFKDYGLQPYVKYELQSVHATTLKQVGATVATLNFQNRLRSEHRYGVGLNYFISGHNASIKVLYEYVSRYRRALVTTQAEPATNSELTLQLQFFSF